MTSQFKGYWTSMMLTSMIRCSRLWPRLGSMTTRKIATDRYPRNAWAAPIEWMRWLCKDMLLSNVVRNLSQTRNTLRVGRQVGSGPRPQIWASPTRRVWSEVDYMGKMWILRWHVCEMFWRSCEAANIILRENPPHLLPARSKNRG